MAIRVLEIIPTLDRSGAEKQLMLLATGLPRDQFDVHVCVLTRSGPLLRPLKEAGIPVTMIDKSWKIDPAAFFRLRREIRRLSPDLVHTWIFAANAYGRQAAISANAARIVAGERCVDPWKAWHEFMIDRRLAKRTDRIVVNSPGVRDFYIEHGLPGGKFTIIPNGVAAPPPCITSRVQLLDELGLPADSRLIVAIGRLWPQKRFKDLIWAADLLKCVRDDTHLLIVGDGPQRWRLERFREQVEIRDRVHFLGHRDDVPRLLAHADCLWLASKFEGQPNVVMEAMAAAVPVVASDIPGTRDLVINGATGFLVPLGDRAAFARRTNVLLDDAELASRLGAAARRRMLEDFSVEKMIERHAGLYRELVQGAA